MKISGRTLMALALAAISIGIILNARHWPPEVASFPLTVAVLLLVMSVIEVCLSLRRKEEGRAEVADFQMASAEELEIDQATVNRRVLLISAWILAFFILILLCSFPVALPLFFILFLRFYAKEKWPTTIVMAFVAWAFFYGLFVRMLHIIFSDGWIMEGLRALGVV